MNLTIDTFAWIEILRGGRAGRFARQQMSRADVCFTPAIVLAEFANACLRDGLSDQQTADELWGVREASEVVPIDSEIALRAPHDLVELRLKAGGRKVGRPGLADALILASARTRDAPVLTGDPHFAGLAETIWIG